MKIIDRRAIEAARKPYCELCGRRGPVEVHHVFSRGMGGGGRLDVHFNLISLCWQCHRAYHDGRISRERILQAVARRYGVRVEEIENQIRGLGQG
ncbi:MAG: hypothetical protein HPY71_01580 [Firmicutes bacterium]|nr:hypothetical protein [Bacillota bacterium]